jgi:hypothetical protein
MRLFWFGRKGAGRRAGFETCGIPRRRERCDIEVAICSDDACLRRPEWHEWLDCKRNRRPRHEIGSGNHSEGDSQGRRWAYGGRIGQAHVETQFLTSEEQCPPLIASTRSAMLCAVVMTPLGEAVALGIL